MGFAVANTEARVPGSPGDKDFTSEVSPGSDTPFPPTLPELWDLTNRRLDVHSALYLYDLGQVTNLPEPHSSLTNQKSKCRMDKTTHVHRRCLINYPVIFLIELALMLVNSGGTFAEH